jgi:hypothetical protein
MEHFELETRTICPIIWALLNEQVSRLNTQMLLTDSDDRHVQSLRVCSRQEIPSRSMTRMVTVGKRRFLERLILTRQLLGTSSALD